MESDVSLCAPDLRTMELVLVGLLPVHTGPSLAAAGGDWLFPDCANRSCPADNCPCWQVKCGSKSYPTDHAWRPFTVPTLIPFFTSSASLSPRPNSVRLRTSRVPKTTT